ncbi:MAG: hypothetical protein PVH62_09790, partial [Anaerolineae bacterium]
MDSLGLFLLSAAALAFEVNLTRIFSVAQFYHFAFMTVSLALLGFGASGTLQSLVPSLARYPRRVLMACSWGFALTAVGSYGLTLLVPFDSFRIALDPEQWGVLVLHYLALTTPFLCAGAAVGLLLTIHPRAVGGTYAANLTGSAAGCLVAVVTPALVGAEGVVLLGAALGALSAIAFSLRAAKTESVTEPRNVLVLGLQGALAILLILAAFHPPTFVEIRVSPYKALSYALQYPDAQLVFRRWNGFSRVDVVDAAEVRSLPGQGFACSGQPPPQRGLFVDGDNLSPITHVSEPADLAPLTDCLLTALPYRLRPHSHVLMLNSRAGFELLVALAEGVDAVTAVEPNPLVVRAVRDQGAWAGYVYDHPRVRLYQEEGRAYLARSGPSYDLVVLPSPGTYHPVTSGAYSLAEDYNYTVEGFVAALERVEKEGLMVAVRWLQVPPSESLRAFALAAEAVERTGGDPARSLVALRSYSRMLILARQGPFTAQELDQIRSFAGDRFFDLVYAPDIHPREVNRYNVLSAPDYYRSFAALLNAEDRSAWLAAYPFDVTLPTDDRPFFGHFFRWRQAGEVLAMAGHIWQPFGGAGYLVLLVLLTVATAAAGTLVLLPLVRVRARVQLPPDERSTEPRSAKRWVGLVTFALLGLAYLFVEIPLLQRFILFLGHPAYAMATVLGALLLFSGVGSLLSTRVRLSLAMAALVGLVVFYRLVGIPLLSGPLLGLPLMARVGVAVIG